MEADSTEVVEKEEEEKEKKEEKKEEKEEWISNLEHWMFKLGDVKMYMVLISEILV